MSMSATIKAKLQAAISPIRLEVEDQSHLHAGHAGAPDGGESHFEVLIVAEVFQDMSRLARQRLVNEALRDELSSSIHALSIRAMSPNEAIVNS